MNEISILDAWILWLAGHLSPHSTIWGVSIFWWGRLGKMMQFIGAATIIADIIGPEKIRAFGSSLHGAVTTKVLIELLKECFEWYVVVFRHTLMKDYADDTLVKRRAAPSKIEGLNYFVCLLLTIAAILLTRLHQIGWMILIAAPMIYGCLFVSLSPIVTVLTILLLAALGFMINGVCIKSLAWLLEHPSLDRLTKIASLLFLVLGFHFELLAS